MADIGTDIGKAIHILQQNELVAIPTETVYGLAGNALEPNAIAKIYLTKNRPYFDPLITHVDRLEKVLELVTDIPEIALQLAKKFWPGPLTLLLPKKEGIPDLLTSGLDNMAIRIPNHSLTLDLLRDLTFPLAAPSANPFGYVSPTNAKHVNDQLGEKISYILDGGDSQVGLESTILSIQGEQINVHRLGGLTLESLRPFGTIKLLLNQKSNPKAPGQLDAHYAPGKKMIVGNLQALVKLHPYEDTAIISFKTLYNHPGKQVVLSPQGDLSQAATHLFGALRLMDHPEVSLIISEWVPEEGIGRAINDRLKRASFI
jgi:L-threonylcarbamoyladenylate synthase